MKLVFWLLDINYEVKEKKPEVWLWGIDDKQQRVLIIDRNFFTYYYLLVKEGSNPQEIVKSVESRRAEFPAIVKTEVVNRKYFGKPVSAVKIVCEDPEAVSKYAKAMAKIEGVKESVEDDIRYSMRYLIDNGMSPCGWHEVEAEQTKNTFNVQVDKVYVAKTFPKSIERTEVPKLRILGFSTVAYSPKGAAKPEKNPVAVISAVTSAGGKEQFVAKSNGDKQVLEGFVNCVRDFNPDIVVGYGTNRQDWIYLTARAKKLGIKLFVDRASAEPHMSVYGHVSVTGRANVDLYDFADELPEVKVKTLENIADFLDVIPVEKRTLVEEVDYAAYWEDSKKRAVLLKFSLENAQSVFGVAEALLGFAMQLSSLVGLPLDHVGTAAVGFRVEWYLMREAYRIGELIPKRVERPYFPYAGAVVLAPKPGLHENIAVLDFKAMYPSIMIHYNVSPDTYVPESEPEPKNGVNVAPEVKYRFRKEPEGFYKQVLSSLIAARDQIRPKLNRLDPKSPEYKVLDARQKAVKVITNATYGYAGWIGARWYIKPVAEAATAWGRHTIMNTVELAKKIGLEVIYSDTDSVFVKNEPNQIKQISAEVEKTLGLEIKADEVYTRILFTEAKKKYCGLLPDGRLDAVGLEVVRGDWAGCAKSMQEKVLEIVLKEQAPEKAAEFVKTYISDLRSKKVPYKDLVIWKTLTKKAKEYEVKAPHVEAAKRLLKEGYALSMGDKIGYVITVGSGKLYERAKPYALASPDEVDTEYYVTNQVLPAASRVLAMFGFKEDALLPSKETLTKKLG